jgi:hypothetical protein
MICFAGIGLLLLIAMAGDTAINKIPAKIQDYRSKLESVTTADDGETSPDPILVEEKATVNEPTPATEPTEIDSSNATAVD